MKRTYVFEGMESTIKCPCCGVGIDIRLEPKQLMSIEIEQCDVQVIEQHEIPAPTVRYP